MDLSQCITYITHYRITTLVILVMRVVHFPKVLMQPIRQQLSQGTQGR
jgi:hypothetical protein